MRRILVVEDEDTLRDVYYMILSTQPYQVDVAKNGQVALELCEKNKYDLILLDIMMPVMDGLAFLRIYQDKGHDHARIIIMSNLSSGKEVNEAVSMGASKSILKADMSPRQLISTVRYELEA